MSICVGGSGLVGAAVFAAPRCARDTVQRQRRGVNDPGIAPQFHTYVGSKAPWDRIHDDLPQYEEAWIEPTPAAAGAPR